MNGLQKFYAGLCVSFGVAAVAILVSGNITMMALTVLGFAAFGLIFMGMMCVLPGTVGHNTVPAAATVSTPRNPRMSLRRFVNAWAHPVPVELGRPKLQ